MQSELEVGMPGAYSKLTSVGGACHVAIVFHASPRQVLGACQAVIVFYASPLGGVAFHCLGGDSTGLDAL